MSTARTKEFYQLIKVISLIAIFISSIIGTLAYVVGLTSLAITSYLLVILCGFSFYLAKIRNGWADDMLILTFLVTFVTTPYFGMHYMAGLCLFLTTISLTIFFVRTLRLQILYLSLAFVMSILTLYNLVSHHNLDNSHFPIELLIFTGSFISIIIINYKFIQKIQKSNFSLKNRDEQLTKKNQDLEKYISSNLQLENYAHMTSHELKTPISNLANISGLLQKKMKEKLTKEEQELLNMIEGNAKDLNEKINALMHLSKVDSLNPVMERIVPYSFIRTVIERHFNAYNIELNIFSKEIFGSKKLLEMLFTHLIQNGIEFNQNPPSEKKIIIEELKFDSGFSFAIHDNGIGIGQEYREKVFLMFQKLEKPLNPTGRGVGLAICKRIVNRHNGRIWVENSKLGGTTMTFTIQPSVRDFATSA